ncbi:MAG TPA: hypothetical protein DEP87_03470 [Candidatus Pacebacteria bacterium]|nr:hypothetical protein [Candidatus Paceibacterota bacterium]
MENEFVLPEEPIFTKKFEVGDRVIYQDRVATIIQTVFGKYHLQFGDDNTITKTSVYEVELEKLFLMTLFKNK